MGLIKEPKEIDFSIKSEPWTDKDLMDFRFLMIEIKDKNNKNKFSSIRKPKKPIVKTALKD